MALALRFAPRASLGLHSRQLKLRLANQAVRNASSVPPPKPRVLEKPERFNPPSHPARIRKTPRYYGPDLSQDEHQKQKTRQYPHMMPPEGSFMHYFLTDRKIHLFISMGVLFMLVFGIWFEDFIHSTPYRDLLPPNSLLFAHPISFFSRWVEVYNMHTQFVSREVSDRRNEKLNDVSKRREYRKAHGLEENKTIWERWTGRKSSSKSDAIPGKEHLEVEASPQSVVAKDNSSTYVDFDGKVQPERKKWLGIW